MSTLSVTAPAQALRLRAVKCCCTAQPMATHIKIGTRGSKLAQLQVQQVKAMLQKSKPEWGEDYLNTIIFKTHGDKETEQQLRNLVRELSQVIDQAVARGAVDMGVHSLKDQPVCLPSGVKLAACLPRDDPRDAFISLRAHAVGELPTHDSLACTSHASWSQAYWDADSTPQNYKADLPRGARVGTSSLRRKAQLLHSHPHLKVMPVRGNIDTRLEMLESGDLDAIVLAAAGLSRLGQQHLMTRVLDFDEMLPAACQGAIGITCNSQDSFLSWELGLICHEPTLLEVTAERAMLAELLTPSQDSASSDIPNNSRGGPAVPSSAPTLTGISSVTGLPLLPKFAIACHASFDPHEGTLKVAGLVASEDGRTLHRLQVSGGVGAPNDAESLGKQLGRLLKEFAEQHGWFD